jgi:hypothetical protein
MGMRGVCRVTLLARCEVLALAAWHGIPQHHLPTHVPPSATRHTHTPTQADNKSPADPVSRGTLPTAPAPTPRSCKRLRFFHGRTAARRQMGKWATVRVGIGMRCHPCVRHHRLLARALAAVACPGERGSDWINAILVPLARTRVCGCASHCCAGAVSTSSPMG